MSAPAAYAATRSMRPDSGCLLQSTPETAACHFASRFARLAAPRPRGPSRAHGRHRRRHRPAVNTIRARNRDRVDAANSLVGPFGAKLQRQIAGDDPVLAEIGSLLETDTIRHCTGPPHESDAAAAIVR